MRKIVLIFRTFFLHFFFFHFQWNFISFKLILVLNHYNKIYYLVFIFFASFQLQIIKSHWFSNVFVTSEKDNKGLPFVVSLAQHVVTLVYAVIFLVIRFRDVVDAVVVSNCWFDVIEFVPSDVVRWSTIMTFDWYRLTCDTKGFFFRY